MPDLTALIQQADGGDADAQFALGYRLATGQNVEKDTGRALQYLLKATKQDHADAMYHLAMLLENGIGLAQPNAVLAARMYLRGVAKHNDQRAARCLGIMHATGNGVEHDPELAQALFEYAISAGEDQAMYCLGLLLANKGDIPEAVMWAVLSMQYDPEGSGARLMQALVDRVPPERIVEGRARAASWQRVPKGLSMVTIGGDVEDEFAGINFQFDPDGVSHR